VVGRIFLNTLMEKIKSILKTPKAKKVIVVLILFALARVGLGFVPEEFVSDVVDVAVEASQ
jgi:hypothetical protein